MTTDGFFGQPTPQSPVKAKIVAEYFWGWATVLHGRARRRGLPLRYLDLYAGTGKYDDGSRSTPLLVLSKAIDDDHFGDWITAHLNEKDPENYSRLVTAVRSLPRIDRLRYSPPFENSEVGPKIAALYAAESPVPPTLSFVDPWGYKGLTLGLIRALTREWGCDCIFFFNYNRINAHLNNPNVTEEMDALFGPVRAANLRGRINGLNPSQREEVIVREIKTAMEEGGSNRRSFSFRFISDAAERTSHHLILVTRDGPGLTIMKHILSKLSTTSTQGVPSYEFNPRLARPEDRVVQLGFLPPREPLPLDNLQLRLKEHFAGRTKSVAQIMREFDRVDDRYLRRNYKDTLLRLEDDGAITATPPASKRQQRNGVPTIGDAVMIEFPPREA